MSVDLNYIRIDAGANWLMGGNAYLKTKKESQRVFTYLTREKRMGNKTDT